jgi:hypothetical protein
MTLQQYKVQKFENIKRGPYTLKVCHRILLTHNDQTARWTSPMSL